MNLREERLEQLGRALAAAQDEAIAMRRRVWRNRMREHVLERAAPEPRASRAWWIGGAALAAAAVLAWIVVPDDEVPPSSAPQVVARAPATPAQVVVAPREEDLAIDLAEHSRVELARGTRAAIRSTPRGGHVTVERGRARFVLEPGDGTWTITSGETRIRAHHASFRVEVGGAVHVSVEHGAVEVLEGPWQGRRIEAGDVLSPEPEPEDAAPAIEAEGPARPASRSSKSTRVRPAIERTVIEPSEPAEPGWRALADRGEFRAAWARAEREGLAELRANLDAAGLLRLADVARYSGQTRAATQLLLTVRKRFPGSVVAATAAFDLARLEASRCDRAQKWLKTYLAEQPRGTMATEAHARLSECEPGGQ